MIETVLYSHLSSDADLSQKLSSYNNSPAVFQQFSPSDDDSAWDSKEQYARIIYDIDTSDDPERKAAGTLMMDAVCSEASSTPEEITIALKNAVDGYFFTENGDTFAAVWSRTDGFTSENNKKVFGNTLAFSLLAFPMQNTTPLDPIADINAWTENLYPNAKIIGYSTIEDVWKPTDESPAIYWRATTSNSPSLYPSTYHCTWITSALQLHVMSPSREARNTIVKTIMEKLSADIRFMLSDGSPFMINRIIGNMGADPLRVGQLTVEGQYGILRVYPDVPKLNNANIDPID